VDRGRRILVHLRGCDRGWRHGSVVSVSGAGTGSSRAFVGASGYSGYPCGRTKRDLPVYLTGLGSVQAFFTVGIRSQVDGKLEEVLFTAEQGSPVE
jgi:hypothetical protein